MLFNELWSNEHFAVQSAMVARDATEPVADLQPSIIFHHGSVDAQYHLTEPLAVEAPPSFSSGELRGVWSINQLEIFNPQSTPQKILKVIFKPPADSVPAFPRELVGVASAALLASDWNERFRASVLEDLNSIGDFAQPFWTGQTPSEGVIARAGLGKQDFDLKLQWSAGEYARRSIFSMGPSPSTPKAASSSGLITLTINTRDAANTKDISGCTVWYVARINRLNSASYRSFSKYSTPTSESLAVGNYEVWAEMSGATGPRRTISVSSVSTTQSADITAP